MEYDFVKLDRGTGVFFKINKSVLLENEYQRQIRQNIENIWELNNDSNPNTLRKLIIGAIGNVTIKYTCEKKKRENEKGKTIPKIYLKHRKRLLEKNNQQEVENTKQRLNEKKHEANGIIDHRIHGILIRSKVNKIELTKKLKLFC